MVLGHRQPELPFVNYYWVIPCVEQEAQNNCHSIRFQKHLLISGLVHVFITFLKSFFMVAHMICPEGRSQPCSYSWLRNSSVVLCSALPVYPSKQGFSFLCVFLDSRDKAIFCSNYFKCLCFLFVAEELEGVRLMLNFLPPIPNLIRSCKQIKLNWTKSFSVPKAERLCEVCKEARVGMHPPSQHLKLRITNNNE